MYGYQIYACPFVQMELSGKTQSSAMPLIYCLQQELLSLMQADARRSNMSQNMFKRRKNVPERVHT